MSSHLLDWKLDFKNPLLADKFALEYNMFMVSHTRYVLIALIAFGVLVPVQSHLYSDTPLTFDIFCAIWVFTLWCSIYLLIYVKMWPHKYVGDLTGSMFVGVVTIIMVFNRIKPGNYLADPQDYYMSVLLMITPVMLRPRSKEFIPPSMATVSTVIVLGMVKHTYPLHMRIGFAVPTLINWGLSAYYGYVFEKRWKHDFIRRLIVEAESSKLKLALQRDSSLLRNIFPTNISNELEQHMSLTSRQKKKENEKAKEGKLQSKSSLRPVLKTISSLMRGTSRVAHSPVSSTSLLSTDSTSTPSSPESSPKVSSRVPLAARKQHAWDAKPEFVPEASGRFAKLSLNIPQPPTWNDDISLQPRDASIGYVLPPIISAPCSTPQAVPVDFDIRALGKLIRTSSVTTSLRSQPELVNVLNIQHSDGSQIALSHQYNNVTVIFADIVGFTSMSDLISPQELCTLLNDLFSGFDDIVSFYHLEKIRTVGDAYLCVANMSVPIDNPEEVAVCAALRMIKAVRKMQGDLRLRVGIASGPLVAGVTGIMKWNYDIFGAPFVDAMTMETLAPPNHIAVTQSVHEACKSHPRLFFQCNKTEDNQDCYLLLSSAANEEINPRQVAHSPVSPDATNDPTVGEVSLVVSTSSGDLREELQKLSMGEILGVSDEDDDEITALDFQLGAAFKLGYSQEDVETEEKRMRKWRTYSFKTAQFEHNYQQETIKEVHRSTTYLSIFYGILCLVYLLLDIATTPSGHPSEVPVANKASFCVSALLLFAYPIFARYFDYRSFSNFVSFIVILCFTLSFIIVAYNSPTQPHFTWCFFALFYNSMYIRTPLPWVFLSQCILISSTSIIVLLRADFPLRSRIILLMITAFLLCLAGQVVLERSSRRAFLARKKIRYDMFRQRMVQYRTQLLLHNILPAEIIPRLNTHSTNTELVVDLFEQATMMFVNLTNLAELTAGLDAESTIKVYNDLFTLCDEATMACGLEKIKTINTVYMVACGLPKRTNNHADMAVKLAIEIYRIISNYRVAFITKKFTVRIGIASGPVVAGIIGKTKYSYDCWSDTTNTASRMESNGWNGYLQATSETFSLISNKSYFQKREQVSIKGKGTMETYVLHLAKFVK